MSLNGIKTIRLKVLKNPKGDLLKYINKNSKFFKKFGETYFVEIKKNYEKGWNFHKRYHCLLTVPFGKVRFTFLSNINKRKKIKVITIGKKNLSLIYVPPRIWFKFKSISKISVIANTLNGIHKKSETLKVNID
jgi:dTDP-4-dehydrorhamnose 3,5-epimerase-like enzyme